MQPTNPPFGRTGAALPQTEAPFSRNGSGFPTSDQRPPPPNNDFSFKNVVELFFDVLRALRSKWYWGVLAAALVAGPVAYLLFKRPTEYTANTTLLAQSTLDKVIGTQADADGPSEQARENNLRNHLSMMTSRRFRVRLAAAFTDEEKRQIAAPYVNPNTPAVGIDFFQDFFDSAISVDRERGREYYIIAVTHRTAETALLIANRVATEYLAYVQQEYKEANLHGYALLEKQANAIRADIARVEAARLDFRKKNGIISRTDNQGILTERLKRIDSSLTDIRVKRRGLETLTKQAQADRAKSKYPWENAYLAGFANNETLRQELDRQTAAQAVLASRYGPNHPKMRDVNSHISAIESSIQRNFDVAVRDLEAQLDASEQNEKLLKKEFDDAFESSIEIEKLASNYEILSAGVDSKKITLIELEKKIAEASNSSKLPTDFMQVVDPAYLMKHRVPKKVLFGVVVGLLALGAFLVTPLVASALDDRVSCSNDVERVLGIGLAGGVPLIKLKPEDRARAVSNRLDPVAAEAFVGIVGQLETSSPYRYPKVIAVTSSTPGEGKTLIASNLASTFRQLGRKTVLVDLDLRRPTQNSLHGLTQEKGFLTWAKAGFPADDDFRAQANYLSVIKLADGTDLICAGGSEPQPGQFLIGEPIQRLIGDLKETYEVVILDTPPAGVFHDALMLSRYTTERLLVVREATASVSQVKQVIEEFAKSNLPFQGVILNGFNPRNANKKLAYGYKAAAAQRYSYQLPKDSNRPAPNKVPKMAPAKS